MRQRSSSFSNASLPAASIFSQWRGFKRMDRCTRRSSSGSGGRPPGFLGCSMRRSIRDA